MQESNQQLKNRQLRPPETNGGMLIEPPLAEIAQLLQINTQRRAEGEYDLQGCKLDKLIQAARGSLVQKAAHYTRQYRDVLVTQERPQCLILAGHQPELFHPGVWLKNFALGKLAVRHGATAINLLIDSDTVQDASVYVPGGDIHAPTSVRVPLDRNTGELPLEERAVLDEDLFRDFGRRATEIVQSLVCHPLLEQFWPLVTGRARETGNLGQSLAQARHVLEGRWGLSTLELPQSLVCTIEAFHWFTAHLLAQLPRWWELHNAALADIRAQRGIRSRSHPLPDLAIREGWLEAPFWIWSKQQPGRRPLFAKGSGDHIEISDLEKLKIGLTLNADGEAHQAVGQLAELADRGIKLRTRAAGTTMFARLFLSDLFVHGIGGAKYDELTDDLWKRFFGFEPPEFLVVSATLQLPIGRPQVAREDTRRVEHLLRELDYHPENQVQCSALSSPEEVAHVKQLIEAKRHWIDTARNTKGTRHRHEDIAQINAGFQPYVVPVRQQLLEELKTLTHALKAEEILTARDYAFCLHPEAELKKLIDQLPLAEC